MDKNINYGYHDILYCITCRKTMYITNYHKHLKSIVHKKNLQTKKFNKRHINKKKNNYLVEFN